MSEREDLDELERQLGRILRAGVTLSTVALAAGLLAAFTVGATPLATSLLAIGVVVLIATPVARVAVSSIAYARRHDWTFMVLTLIVLGELVASLIAAVRGG